MMHIHNGDVVAAFARRSGIPGEHVSYRESLVMGPVVPGDDWIENRAHALAQRFHEDLLRVRTDLLEQEQLLDAAPSQGEIVLWFEHDLYCLIHLLHLLQRFADARVSVIWCPEPLSNNDERGLDLLFESRAAATPSMIALARDAWSAYTSPDAASLNAWLVRDTPDFPFLREGLTLHASRFPSTRSGLGAIEQQALELVAAGTSDWLSLFDQLNSRVPRFGFGDSQVFETLRGIATCAVPLLNISGDVPKAIVTITPAGENVLRGEVDNLAVNDPDFWLGGVHLTKENVWRWDGARLSRSAAS
ncbi:MAG TPA: hypothetical protein VF432_28280 [Thermoanaerobaculia bacterium]